MSESRPDPCPFCAATYLNEDGPIGTTMADDARDLYRVECDDCGAAGPLAPTARQAVKLWNSRDISWMARK